MSGEDHRDLIVWQQSMTLVELVYVATAAFPPDERFGLTAQMRRSAISIPANIAEGAGRNSSKELMHFVGIASGSRAELCTHLELARRLSFISADSLVFQQADRVGKLLTALRKSLRNREPA